MKTSNDQNGRQAELRAYGRSSDASIPREEQTRLNTKPHSTDRVLLSIAGMTCGSCAAKVQTGLRKISGVQSAQVRLADSTALVQYDGRQTNLNEMRTALETIGYKAQVGVNDGNTALPTTVRSAKWLKAPVLWGAAAALAVVGFYLGLITLTSDWSYAAYQFSQYGGWVITLAVGLSLQVGLFVRMRSIMAGRHTGGAGKGIAASGSMSGVAMAICCSHYLATVLPAIGLPFLSGAVAGLAQYQTAFFIVGVLSNLLGLAYMLGLMFRNGKLGLLVAYRSG